MAGESQNEQAQAGVSRLSGDESARLDALNRCYETAFGFPFIMAVRGKTKNDILEEIKIRLQQTKSAEFERALEEIYKIAKFRLEEKVSP
ncbi:2-oxo-4-hydroxy-4-carboxy-5-ureidoimidazoline decarboxylase [Terrilactibacillus sp. S3-3]|nr:2-oxo-4-hydroxy-4-carboxy-5-ureidoimidazoline decarboxylase [Terrilactibacillus sp. S3-3]